MASPLEAPPVLNYSLAIKELEKGCELTARLRAHLGMVLKDGVDSQFRHIFEEISQTLALSREILTTSDQYLPGTEIVTPHEAEGPKFKKRKREEKFNDCQRRKYNAKRTEFTRMPYHDGYQWRKYGQKNILNKNYPRCYYRCTYYQDRNCTAAKQVQRCNNEDLPLFEVTYFDEHTCNNVISNSKSKSTTNHNLIDFSGISILESKCLSNTMDCRRQNEEATVVSCLTNVVKGYNSEISENSNGGHNLQYNCNESSISTNDDIYSREIMLREFEFPMAHSTTTDIEWWGQDNIQFLSEL